MSIAKFWVKYPRPEKLSDPYNDFNAELLDSILATPDDQMEWYQYRNLLGPFLPAGTYEESVYFLPAAFRYFLAQKEHAVELTTPIIGFVSRHKEQLDKDKLAYVVKACLRECLDHFTAQFEVIPYAYVENAELVVGMTTELVEFEHYADVAREFVRDLADHHNNPLKAAWFLEYARSKDAVYHPPDDDAITSLIDDKMRLRLAAEVVRKDIAPNEASPTYWPDAFAKLAIDWSLPVPENTEHAPPEYPRELYPYMDTDGRLTEWPSPRNKKGLQRLALEYLAAKFAFERNYAEKEVNAILNQFHTFGDHALLRRELYDKGFFDRKRDGTAYWRTKPSEPKIEG